MIIDGFFHQLPDSDPAETQEWVDSLDAVIDVHGPGRARSLLTRLLARSRERQVDIPASVSTPYVNTIPPDEEPWFPGDEHLERRIRAYIRWNAAVMVIKANKHAPGIGGHLATFASSAALYDVGFNHFWRGKADGQPGDHIYFQGHGAPGIYARAFVEGRLSAERLDRFRRETDGPGLTSYPHPRLMPDFWEYPTVSMGLGPIASIHQARLLRYLHDRRLDDTTGSRVWCFLGDGEMDEPETFGSVSLASREHLDNLVWVVSCNLQRLDGPVRGNGKIIQELEAAFRGAGWNVIKVIWGRAWDDLLAQDVDGVLVEKMNTTVDGEFQRHATESGAYIREHFFGPDPRLRQLVEHLSDDELRWLPRGGHDYRKLYAAYRAATEHRGTPTVILAKTIKGWTLGPQVEARNATHQIKKMTNAQLRELRERLRLEEQVPLDQLADDSEPPYLRLPEGSEEAAYLHQRQRALGGPIPTRMAATRRPLPRPSAAPFDNVFAGSKDQPVSTTMAFTRLLRDLCREPDFGERVVPIIPDEARTFGMDALFPEFGIYASQGQLYEPVDHDLLLNYRESKDGQILEEGITEAGSMASFIAAGTAYANRGVPMVPFFTFYSMFGFQRIGDLVWAANDARARGFLLGATAGRTTLMGEGLQHQDGHSPILASTVPSTEVWDPAFAYEMAAIIRDGLRRMYPSDDPRDGEDLISYMALYNENYPMPAMPEGVEGSILEGLYRFSEPPDGSTGRRATILFSGTAQQAARDARAELAEHYDIAADLWSVTSWKLLREEALSVERWNRLHPASAPRIPIVADRLAGEGPVVAVTDYMKAVPDQIARWVPRPFNPLGTDGFGPSDTREALRRHFETDAGNIVTATLASLHADGHIRTAAVVDALDRYDIDPDRVDPRIG